MPYKTPTGTKVTSFYQPKGAMGAMSDNERKMMQRQTAQFKNDAEFMNRPGVIAAETITGLPKAAAQVGKNLASGAMKMIKKGAQAGAMAGKVIGAIPRNITGQDKFIKGLKKESPEQYMQRTDPVSLKNFKKANPNLPFTGEDLKRYNAK